MLPLPGSIWRARHRIFTLGSDFVSLCFKFQLVCIQGGLHHRCAVSMIQKLQGTPASTRKSLPVGCPVLAFFCHWLMILMDVIDCLCDSLRLVAPWAMVDSCLLGLHMQQPRQWQASAGRMKAPSLGTLHGLSPLFHTFSVRNAIFKGI